MVVIFILIQSMMKEVPNALGNGDDGTTLKPLKQLTRLHQSFIGLSADIFIDLSAESETEETKKNRPLLLTPASPVMTEVQLVRLGPMPTHSLKWLFLYNAKSTSSIALSVFIDVRAMM